jgi:hypothetical protein
MVRVVSAVQQIMTELSGAVSEEAKMLGITKLVFSLMKDNDRLHRSRKVIAFNANDNGK